MEKNPEKNFSRAIVPPSEKPEKGGMEGGYGEGVGGGGYRRGSGGAVLGFSI